MITLVLVGLPGTEFVLRATDFAALSSTRNMLSALHKMGCQHFHSILKKSFEFEAPGSLADSVREINVGAKWSIRDFLGRFGREDAQRLADARSTQVCVVVFLI